MAVQNVVTYQPQTVNLDPFTQISLPVSAWMTTLAAADVPGDSVPWMLAQGWQIASIDKDGTTTPPTPYYNMTKQGMINWAVLQSLVNTYTDAYNEGRSKNALRYDNIVANWSTQIGQCVTSLNNAVADSNAYVSLYIANLGSFMDQVAGMIATANSQSQSLINYAVNLGLQETLRINEQFDNLKAQNAQQLASRGLYSSAILAQMNARAERERAMALGDLNDRLNREKYDLQKFSIQSQHTLIGQQLQVNLERLKGQTETHAQEMDLYKYMIDTTNGIIIGLFGFEERRTDAYPSLEIMAQLCTQLGDAGATSWVSP